jgi:predicted ATPase/DNA-binding CsgD family transcriptional regulator
MSGRDVRESFHFYRIAAHGSQTGLKVWQEKIVRVSAINIGFAMANSPFDRPNPLVDSLTHREREILARLAGDLYNREIAEALTLAPSSIKWYTRQIYAKLGVNSRREAIQRARELGLLDLKTTAVLRTHNIPASLTPFIGRQNDLEQIRPMLNDPAYRLVTLTGAGGVGKTRLAMKLANEIHGNFPQGAWLVELASLTKPELLSQSVAAVFELRPDQDRPILTVLIDYLRTRKLLLVLDNCEHLVNACASLASTLLKACPDLHVLATSREALGIEGEIAYRVPSLTFPDRGQQIPLEQLANYEAVQLFTHRARVAVPGFELTEVYAATVVQICQHLDGIPLALELAAAHVKTLEVEQIASQLDDRFRLLVGGDRAALPRLQTMRASIDWSYQLLSDAEKALLGRLSVFAGGWTLAAAKAVCADDALPEADILGLLGQLVEKSLVLVIRRRGQELRYHLLETVRQYAAGKFADTMDIKSVRDRHLAYFVSFIEKAHAGLDGPKPAEWMKRLDREIDNLRLALGWSLVNNVEAGMLITSLVGTFWRDRGYIRERHDWLDKLLALPAAQTFPQTYGRALGIQASILTDLGDTTQARLYAEKSLALCRELGDRFGEAFSLSVLGQTIFSIEEEVILARTLLEESISIFQDLEDRTGQAIASACLIGVYAEDFDRELSRGKQILIFLQEAGNRIGIATQLYNLANMAYHHADYTSAHEWNEEALTILWELGLEHEIIYCLQLRGLLAFRQGKYDQARKSQQESIALGEESGNFVADSWGHAHLAHTLLRQGENALAYAEFKNSLGRFQKIKIEIGTIYTIEGLASLATTQGQARRAVRLYAWADTWRQKLAQHRFPNEQADVDHDSVTIRTQLDDATILAAEAAGRAMTIKDAVAYALGDED